VADDIRITADYSKSEARLDICLKKTAYSGDFCLKKPILVRPFKHIADPKIDHYVLAIRTLEDA